MANILGVRVDDLNFKQALIKVDQLLLEKKPVFIVTPNPEFLVCAKKNSQFKEILNQADLSLADGVGLLWAAKKLNQTISERITGVDFMEALCQLAAFKKYPVLLYGAGPGVAPKVAQNLLKKYPDLKIRVLAKPDPEATGFLFVALGAFKQEKWIVDNLAQMPQLKLAMGVGGSFDFISGQVSRAPLIFRKKGLEWLWRLGQQPSRLVRILKATLVFPYLVLKEKYGQN